MLSLLALFVTASDTRSPDDWPQFQGLRRDATSTETGLCRSFPEDGPPVLWTLDVAEGFGGAAVRGQEVFVLDRDGDDGDMLRCLDLGTGEELWSTGYPARGRLDFPGSRGVPLVTEDRVFTIGGFGHVTCVDRETKETVWQVALGERYRAAPPHWGWAQSPLVVGNTVIVAVLSEEVGLAALDADDG